MTVNDVILKKPEKNKRFLICMQIEQTLAVKFKIKCRINNWSITYNKYGKKKLSFLLIEKGVTCIEMGKKMRKAEEGMIEREK